MADEMFDVQNALLYRSKPAINRDALLAQLSEYQSASSALPELELLGGSTDDYLILAGGGVHATILVQDTPSTAGFTTQLAAPILQLKVFDYGALIAEHRAAIILNVGDGEVPIGVEARQKMAEMTGARGVDPLLKLATLHMVLQALTRLARPLMVDFLPTMSLLVPEEYEGYAGNSFSG